MSSSPTATGSTTHSSSSSPSRSDPDSGPVAVIACGALAGHVREIAARRGWALEVHKLLAAGRTVVLAYADCGSYGALDSVCRRLGLARLAGLHCYDVFGGAERIR